MRVRLCGLELRNPIIAASGTFGYGIEFEEILSLDRIGAFVTTGLFSRKAQLELAQDKYPIVLINGRRLARVLLEVVTQERIALLDLLEREAEWYEKNTRNFHPSRVLGDAFSFTDIPAAALLDISHNA